jgi:hypothetical protein
MALIKGLIHGLYLYSTAVRGKPLSPPSFEITEAIKKEQDFEREAIEFVQDEIRAEDIYSEDEMISALESQGWRVESKDPGGM